MKCFSSDSLVFFSVLLTILQCFHSENYFGLRKTKTVLTSCDGPYNFPFPAISHFTVLQDGHGTLGRIKIVLHRADTFRYLNKAVQHTHIIIHKSKFHEFRIRLKKSKNLPKSICTICARVL